MKLVRRTNDHLIAVFYYGDNYSADYHDKLTQAMEEQFGFRWAANRPPPTLLLKTSSYYVVNYRRAYEITHSDSAFVEISIKDYDIIEELRTPTRVVDFDKIG